MHQTKNSDPESIQRTPKEKGDNCFPTIGSSDAYCKPKRCSQEPVPEALSKNGNERNNTRATRPVETKSPDRADVGTTWKSLLCFVVWFHSVVQGKDQVCYACHQDTERVILRKRCPVLWNCICPKANVPGSVLTTEQ